MCAATHAAGLVLAGMGGGGWLSQRASEWYLRLIGRGIDVVGVVAFRLHDYFAALTRRWHVGVIIPVGEFDIFATEAQQDVSHCTVAVLGYDELGHAAHVVFVFVLIYLVVLGTVDEADYVCILLDCSRLAQVTELRAFAVDTFAALVITVELRECYDGYVEFLGQSLERA